MTSDQVDGTVRSVKDLKVHRLAYALAMEIFETTKGFPKHETHSLTDHIRKSSRPVANNIREGFAKRYYTQVFVRHLSDALGSSEETRGWLDFSLDCGYITEGQHDGLDERYDEMNAMLYSLRGKWESLGGQE